MAAIGQVNRRRPNERRGGAGGRRRVPLSVVNAEIRALLAEPVIATTALPTRRPVSQSAISSAAATTAAAAAATNRRRTADRHDRRRPIAFSGL